ncbi:hypothetical protein RAS1_02810 [Phycisphaerae bacterium RAS1]|nr:hypothetical protein RAS1_02810 [Phycisphaerae bacterium RAS1]
MNTVSRLALPMSLGAILAAAMSVSQVRAQCPDQWRPIFGVPPGADGQVRAATLWDPDGDGPLTAQPVIGGEFTNAGGIYAGRIARFDGVTWLPFGSSPAVGFGGTVRALTTWDPDGAGPQPRQLIAGGDFLGSGSTTLNRIARWDGAVWQPMDMGFDGNFVTGVYSLIAWDPDGTGPLSERLIAGGNFAATPGGTTVGRVAMWDGAAWQPMGAGFVNGNTTALAVYDSDGSGPQTPRLVAGGNWSTSGSTTVNRIAQWDGAAWQPMNVGFNSGSVVGLTAWDDDGPGPHGEQVVATGSFTMSGTTACQFIARFDGAAWQPLGLGVGSSSNGVATWDPDGPGPMNPEVVAAGNFNWAGGNTVSKIARWNGVSWQGFNTTISTSILALTMWDADGSGSAVATPLIVGNVPTAGTRTVNNIATWNGSDWRQLGDGLWGPTTGQVIAFTTWDPDGAGPAMKQLVAGGSFTIATGKTVNRIARFDGVEWQPLGTGLSSTLWGLTTWDPDGGGPLPDEVVAVGDFVTAGGVTVNQVARYDGTQWQAFGAGIGNHVKAVTVWDTDGPGGNPGAIVVGGHFTEAAGNPGNFVAMWNGASWQGMGSGFINEVFSLATFSPSGNPADTRVYAGGSFGLGGAPPYQLIAQWDGASWQQLYQGVDSYVQCMTVRSAPSPALVIGGAFGQAYNATIAYRIAGWTGSSWIENAFEPGLSGPIAAVVYGLTTWDPDGGGPLGEQVVAGGLFANTIGGPEPALNNIARWDGNWQPLGDGLNQFANALTTWDPDGSGPQTEVLVAGGAFTLAGAVPSPFIAALYPCGPAGVPGDMDCDGDANVLDINAFVLALIDPAGYAAMFPNCDINNADINDDGFVDVLDINPFVALLAGG